MYKYIQLLIMAKLKEATAKRKKARNIGILDQYNLLKRSTTCRKALILVAEMYGVGEGTVRKVVFDPTYPNSPLPSADAVLETTI